MILIKSEQEIEIMKQGGKILAKIIRELKNEVKPGLTTLELDKLATELISDYGAKPAFKGYQGFPNALCVALNQQIVHGVPSEREIKEGDILSLDLGVIFQDYYSDMAVTVAVGEVEPETRRLIRVTKKSLARAISRVKTGKTVGDIGQAIESYVKNQGFDVVRDLCGHGIGKELHEDPEVLNFGQRHKGETLKQGMVLAIEPMAVMGKPGIEKDKDGFAFKTIDNSLSAHFEHTVLVTDRGGVILTE